jgi:hypothetical protein
MNRATIVAVSFPWKRKAKLIRVSNTYNFVTRVCWSSVFVFIKAIKGLDLPIGPNWVWVSAWGRRWSPVSETSFLIKQLSDWYYLENVLSLDGVTIDGVWIGNLIYWTLKHSKSWLHFTNHCYTHRHTIVHSNVLTAVAWWRLPTADIHFRLRSRTGPGLDYQLLTATALKDWSPAAQQFSDCNC